MLKQLRMTSNRSYSLRILYNNNITKTTSHSSNKKIKLFTEVSQQVNKNNSTIISNIRQHEQLNQIFKKVNKNTLDFIERVKPKLKQKKHLKFDSDQQLQHNNNKISNLYVQIQNTQNQLHHMQSIAQTSESIILQQMRKKEELKQRIRLLKRRIDINSKQLVQNTNKNKLNLFDLHNEKQLLNSKLAHFRQKNNKTIIKNNEIGKKIRQIEEKMREYQSDPIIAEQRLRIDLQRQFNEKVVQLEKIKVNAQRQRSRLQHIYFRKLIDFEYTIAGCQAIQNKIIELQNRIIQTNLNYENDSERQTIPVSIRSNQTTILKKSSSEINIIDKNMSSSKKSQNIIGLSGRKRRVKSVLDNESNNKSIIKNSIFS